MTLPSLLLARGERDLQRPTSVKRDVLVSKETLVSLASLLLANWRATSCRQHCRLNTHSQKSSLLLGRAIETQRHFARQGVKRDLLVCQKRPTSVSKEGGCILGRSRTPGMRNGQLFAPAHYLYIYIYTHTHTCVCVCDTHY